MSSLIRNIRRKRLRQVRFTTDDDGNQVRVEHEPKPQFTEARGDGYLTVRYTRGPRLISGVRLRAQGRLAEIQHPGAERAQAREFGRLIEAGQRAAANVKRLADLAARPVASISRQVRRHSLRTGTALPPLIGADTAPEKPKRTRKSRPETQIMEAMVDVAAKKRKSRAKPVQAAA